MSCSADPVLLILTRCLIVFSDSHITLRVLSVSGVCDVCHQDFLSALQTLPCHNVHLTRSKVSYRLLQQHPWDSETAWQCGTSPICKGAVGNVKTPSSQTSNWVHHRRVRLPWWSVPSLACEQHWGYRFSSWPGRHPELRAHSFLNFAMMLSDGTDVLWRYATADSASKLRLSVSLMGIWPPSTCNTSWAGVASALQVSWDEPALRPPGWSSVWFCYGYWPDGDEHSTSRLVCASRYGPCSHCNFAKSGWIEVPKHRGGCRRVCQSHCGITAVMFLDTDFMVTKDVHEI